MNIEEKAWNNFAKVVLTGLAALGMILQVAHPPFPGWMLALVAGITLIIIPVWSRFWRWWYRPR